MAQRNSEAGERGLHLLPPFVLYRRHRLDGAHPHGAGACLTESPFKG